MNSADCPPVDPRTGRSLDDFHPLEIVPFFRRWKAGPLRDLLYTLIWSSAIGVLFWMIGTMFRPHGLSINNLASNLIIANSIGYTMHAMFLVAARTGIDRWARSVGPVFTVVYYTGMSTVGVFVGFALVALALDTSALSWIVQPRWLAVMALSSAVISIVIAAVAFSREREWRAQAELERERLRSERVEREAALANLRALQAQIEPHFLFNTLANVASLVDPDPATAKRMLESFIRFLRASLASTRMEKTTLAAEAELIASFLQVLQVRMGSRLRYVVEVPESLAAFEIAPMLLQPVVENAIRHGLEPKVEGGEVAVRARRDHDAVVVEIADTGVGFAPTTRGGVGLENLRERLKLLYGARATLAIGENRPAGTLVTVRFPA